MSLGSAKLSSGLSQGSGSGGSGGGSSGVCSYYIHDIVVGASDDQMVFSVTNDGSGVLEITGIISALFGTLLTGPALPAFLLAGATVTFTVNSDPAFTDLRGTGFTVQTSCGDQSGVFPVA